MSAWPPPGTIQEIYGNVSGPSSYAAGGFTVDLSSTLRTIDYANVVVETAGSLPHARVEITRNSPANGQFKVKLTRVRYDKLTSIDNVSGSPAGVTVAAVSGQTTGSESAHTHTQSALVAASIDAINGVGNATRVSAATGAGTAHSHTMNTLYQHQHANTQTTTDATATEVANGLDLSATTFRYVARGS